MQGGARARRARRARSSRRASATLKGADGDELPIDFSLLTASSVLFDAVYVPGGAESVAALSAERDAVEFVTEAYRHCKPIAATGEGVDLLRAAGIAEGQGTS